MDKSDWTGEMEREIERWSRMHRESYEAFCAMRNDINELIGGMDSQESTLRNGPEMAHECVAVVKAVRSFKGRAARAERLLAEAVGMLKRVPSAFNGMFSGDAEAGDALQAEIPAFLAKLKEQNDADAS